MNSGIGALSEREKETLRLLLKGHDAKSIARYLGLSVHTVNERLRDSRRKLGVSSSKEAARLLDQSDPVRPNSLGDKEIGVAGIAAPGNDSSRQRRGTDRPLTWLLGGTLIMSLIIAAVLFTSSFGQSNEPPSSTLLASTAASATVPESAATQSAREWVALVDAQQWAQSWRAAGTLFKSQVTAATWAATVEPVRKPLGAVSRRVLQAATEHSALPGAPAGEYQMVEFATNFANKKDAVETVVLAHESTGWKVVGYFIR